MKFILSLILISLLTACGGGAFIVKKSDDRFSESKNPLYISENNRISSKSIAGGFHIDDKGVYINPFIEKDKTTNKIILLGFNQLGTINKVNFRLSDGSIISLKVTNQDNRTSDTVSYNSVANYASYEKWESGIIPISKSNFIKLASAKSISCKIFGSKQPVIYEEKDISDTFLSNLNKFNQQYIK